MAINQTLFKAILSMDSYNRGYNAALDIAETSIGTAEILMTTINNDEVMLDSGIIRENGDRKDDDIGFYALAYDWNGGTVVTYRGADYPNGGPTPPLDITNGWILSAGNYDAAQGPMAVEFYKIVAEEIGGTSIDLQTVDISLTGHSLGGGLSGYVGSLYGQSAEIFDSMGYEDAAESAHFYASMNPSDPQYNTIAVPLIDLIYNGASPWAVSDTLIEAQHIEDEVLAYYDPVVSNWLYANTSAQNSQAISLGPDVDLVSGGESDEAVARHSMSTMVIRLFADYGTLQGSAIPSYWESAAKYFWPVMYDSGFAGQIGLDDTEFNGENRTKGDHASNLRAILAYSAIDEGTLVFGDTGIRAFYDDANGLGSAVSAAGTDSFIEQYATEISKVFINFAGLLALHKIEQDDWSSPYEATDGVLSYVPSTRLSINFDDDLWTLAGNNALPNMIGQAALIGQFLDDTGDETAIRSVMGSLWGDDTTNAFHAVHFALDAGTQTIPNIPGSSTEANLFIGTTGADTVTGSEDHDMLWGDAGDDILKGSQGSDVLYGSDGFDTADYTNVAAFVAATTSSGGGYVVNKYFGQTSATGSYVEDRLFLIEDLKGAFITGGAGGISIDGAGGIVVQGQGMLPPPYNYVPPVTYASGNQNLAHTLRGTGEGETLQGGTAADILDGRDGADTAIGFRGNDLYLYCFTADNDIIDDGGYVTDLDTLWFNCNLAFADLIFERHNASDIKITFTGGAGSVLLKNAMATPIDYIKMRDGTVTDMETVSVTVKGTGAGETLYGTQDNGANREGSLIHDVMYGYGGVDFLYGYSGTDQMYGGAGNDTLYGGDGGDHLYGEADGDTLYGDGGDDFLYGGSGTNTLNGGTGNDTYEGGSGTDTMTDASNSGNEIYVYSGGSDTVYDWGGSDTLRMTGSASIENTTISSSGYDLIVGGNLTISYFNYSAAYKIETIEFSDGSWADLTTHASWIKGTSSGETLNGTTGANTVIAYGGNDTVNALGGADRIFLGEGADTGYGGSGADTIDAGPGNDIIEGGDDNDIIIGGPGADNTKGNAGVDTFVFKSMGDAGDTIQDFNAGAGEKLDISDLLTGFNPATDDITDFVQITDNGTNSVISIDVDGGGDNFVSLATIYGTGLTDEQALLNAGNLVVV